MGLRVRRGRSSASEAGTQNPAPSTAARSAGLSPPATRYDRRQDAPIYLHCTPSGGALPGSPGRARAPPPPATRYDLRQDPPIYLLSPPSAAALLCSQPAPREQVGPL